MALRVATTGLRRGEALALRWADVDLDGAALAIRDSKSGRGRSVALDPGTVTMLRELRRRAAAEKLALGPTNSDEDAVFGPEDGMPYAPNYITRAFREAVEKVEVPRIRLHDLRHTWSPSLPLAAGVSPKIVSSGGHATVASTHDMYTHAIPGCKRTPCQSAGGADRVQ